LGKDVSQLPARHGWIDLDAARKPMIPSVNQVHVAERYPFVSV
jgi:hypothetical protein